MVANKNVPSSRVYADAEAELAVICAMITNPSTILEVQGLLDGLDFADEVYGRLFHFIGLYHAQRVPVDDFIVMKARIPSMNLPGNPDPQELMFRIVSSKAQATNYRYYAQVVRQNARLRQLDEANTKERLLLDGHAPDPEAIVAFRQTANARMDRDCPSEAVSVGSLMAAVADDMDRRRLNPDEIGIETGISSLDAALGPMRPGETIVIGARTGEGKTAMALQIVDFNAKLGKRCLVIELEMTGKELAERQLCQRAKISITKSRSGDVTEQDCQNAAKVATECQSLRTVVWAPPKATIAQIETMVNLCKLQGDLDLIAVDYLTLISPSKDQLSLGMDMRQVWADASKRLKQLAKSAGCPILIVAQLNRNATMATEIDVQHLAETGSTENDADTVLLLSRKPAKNGQPYDIATVSIAKHRHRPKCKVDVAFYGAVTRYADLPTALDHFGTAAKRSAALDNYNEC